MADVAPIQGAVVLTDAWTTTIKAAEKATTEFQQTASGIWVSSATAADNAAESVKKVEVETEKVRRKSKETNPEIFNLKESFKAYDGVLGAVSVNAMWAVKATEDILAAVQKTIPQVGLLGTTALVAGAAMAGWSAGRAIAETLKLDQAIESGVARLMGWKTALQAQREDTLAFIELVSARTGKGFATLSEAMAANEKWMEAWNLRVNRSRDAVRESSDQTAKWRAEIEQVKSDGNIDALTKDLESQNFTVDELSKRYGISVRALEMFTRETENAKDASEKLLAVQERNSAKLRELAFDWEQAAKKRVEADKKAVAEIDSLWNDLAEAQAAHSLSSFDQQKTQINSWFEDQVSKLNTLSPHYAEHYKALQALAKESLDNIKIDWDTLRQHSKVALQEEAEIAEATYREMLLSAHKFTREGMEEQRQKVRETADAARGLGKDFEEAQKKAAAATEEATKKLEEQREEAEKLAAAQRAQSFSFEVTAANIEEQARGFGVNPEFVKAWAKLGYSFQHALEFARKFGNPPPGMPEGPGPRIPGFREGGLVDIKVGEQGPEVVRVPLGSVVHSSGARGVGGGAVINIAPGAIVLNYPIVRDKQAAIHLADVLSEELMARQTILGGRN